MKCVLALLALCVVGCHGYASGPPVKANPAICTNLAPIHESSPQTSTPPYEIVTPSSCYKEGQDVPVFVRVKAGEQTYKDFEGLFILARNNTAKLSVSFGAFSNSDSQLQLQDCFGKTASAIGHNTAEHWTCKKFMWRAPSNFRENVYFHGTVVRHKATYWIGVGSSALTYKSDCTHDATALNGQCNTSAASEGVKGHVMSVVMATMLASILQFVR